MKKGNACGWQISSIALSLLSVTTMKYVNFLTGRKGVPSIRDTSTTSQMDGERSGKTDRNVVVYDIATIAYSMRV